MCRFFFVQDWFQCHSNAPLQVSSSGQNEQAQPNQSNIFHHQQQQPQSSNQPLQPPQFNLITGTQPSCFQSSPAQCQTEGFSTAQRAPNQLSSNPYQQSPQIPNNPPQPVLLPACLPPTILEQIRACMSPSTGPIFILPAGTPISSQPTPSPLAAQSTECPGLRAPCGPLQFYPPQYYPCPMPLPIMSPMIFSSTQPIDNCSYCSKKSPERPKFVANQCEPREHVCAETDDEKICSKRDCPAAINLQALAAQLLAVPGIISCATTRMILQKIAGSNITNSVEEIMDRSKNAMTSLSQDQLLTESRNAQQVTALINLHMTACPPPSIIPILTTVQLKVNLLKNHADKLLSSRVSNCQENAAEGNSQFDPIQLSCKSNEELRQLLTSLRQKECNERINFNYSPYHSQRVIAESRLRNVENKIRQVEGEMEKRRTASAVITCDIGQVDFGVGGSGVWYAYPGITTATCNSTPFRRATAVKPQAYDSPDPFRIEVRSSRRLNLKPHVGSPETTYEREIEHSKEKTFGEVKCNKVEEVNNEISEKVRRDEIEDNGETEKKNSITLDLSSRESADNDDEPERDNGTNEGIAECLDEKLNDTEPSC